MTKRVFYRLTWQWYQHIKGDTLATYTHKEDFSDVLQMGEFLVDIESKPPDREMKLRYKKEMIETTLLEERK